MTTLALINTGGTIATQHPDPLEVCDYGGGRIVSAEELLAELPALPGIACVPIPFAPEYSVNVGFAVWKRLVKACHDAVRDRPELSGIVITHGTASMEETAWFLDLTLAVEQTVVITGSQRPGSAFGTDGAMNLLNALRVAADPASRGRGVLVELNDEIHAARDVTKSATFRLNAFRSPDFGVLGHVDGPHVAYYRKAERRHAPDSAFALNDIAEFPRVDVAYTHADADGVAIDAFVAAGARGVVLAGFAPGTPAMGQIAAIKRACAAGVVVVQSSRAGSGIVHRNRTGAEMGVIAADNLTPQKARILLGLSLASGADADRIRQNFATY